MTKPSRVDELRAQWERALERDKLGDAAKALVELEGMEPGEPQWSHRLGEAYRRLGKKGDAEEAFVRAMDRYAAKGFMPRAVAMAKLVESLNPARGNLLARLDPKPSPLPAPRTPAAAAPAPAPPAPAAPAPAPPAPAPPEPILLERAADAADDEVRFADAPGRSSIEVVLEDMTSDVFAIDDPAEPPNKRESLPTASEPSIDRLATMVGFRLFAGLSREALLALSRAAELVEFVPGAMVIVKDEAAYALYAIVDGTLRVVVRGSPDVRLGTGDVVGEGCLLDEGKRQADVKAETAVMALRIGKTALDEATKAHAQIGDALFELLARRLLMNLMHTSPLFTVFEPRVRLELSQLFEVRRAAPGTVLAERGRRSDGLYVILAGDVMASGKTADAASETRIARGAAFGHASLLGGVPALETVRVATEAVLLRLPAAAFASLAALYPPALAHLSEIAGDPLPPSRLLGD